MCTHIHLPTKLEGCLQIWINVSSGHYQMPRILLSCSCPHEGHLITIMPFASLTALYYGDHEKGSMLWQESLIHQGSKKSFYHIAHRLSYHQFISQVFHSIIANLVYRHVLS
uniref:Uncharacterized protein n=1 Tax=Opuntia streptacantha TaxID=393608 RepID=A0A7C9D2R1_OPUST